MNCPHCGCPTSRVIDSRYAGEGIRRRRQCFECNGRFTTYERVQHASLFVVKKDKRREEFSKDKLLSGIRKACEKRPLPSGTTSKLADDIEAELYHMGRSEISSTVIGDMVMEKLKKYDYIAYIRFASIYRDFADITDLKKAVDTLVGGEDGIKAATSQLPLLPDEKTEVTRKSRGHLRGRLKTGKVEFNSR